MSWLFSQALVAGYSQAKCLDLKQSAQLNVMPTQHKFWHRGKTMEHSNHSRYGLTFQLLTEQFGEGILTWYRVDFLAKTSRQQDLVLDCQAKGLGYGLNSLESSRNAILDLFSSKTQHTLELKDLTKLSKGFPMQGTLVVGRYYPQRNLERTMRESGCGFLPTPTAHNAKEGAYPAEGKRNTPTLAWVLGGKINPQFTEWMMGWPIGWSDLQVLETDKFQTWLHKHLSTFIVN